MKIAHIVSTYPPYYGGMGNVVFQTAEALMQRGHEVTVFTPQFETPTEPEIEHVERLQPSISYGNAARLPQIKNELDAFDLVHLHYPFFGTANLVRKWKERHPDRKLVITYHMDTRAPSWKGLIFKLYAKHYMPKILSAADACIVSSFDYVEVSDAAQIYEGQKDKWHALPFGVDINRFSPGDKPAELFSDHVLDQTLPTVVFVGGMDPAHHFKGVPVLLKALGMLNHGGFEMQAVLVGDGSLRAGFEAKATAYGIEDRVRFVGAVSDEALPFYYRMGDLSVLPSTGRNEAFGMVLLESMASGVPVIASDLPGVRSVAEEGGMAFRTGDAKALADALYGYFDQENDQEAWRLQAREAAETKFAWPSIAEQLEGIYTGVVTG